MSKKRIKERELISMDNPVVIVVGRGVSGGRREHREDK